MYAPFRDSDAVHSSCRGGVGTAGGIAMMAITVVWFFGGLAAGYIFYYPPILFCVALYALFKKRDTPGPKW